jgi:hypothetical protein
VLFDPFEKQFDLPSVPVQFGDCQSRQSETVCQEVKGFFLFGVEEFYAPKFFGIVFFRVKPGKGDGLITSQSGAFVD